MKESSFPYINTDQKSVLIYGNGRSYGDVCLNENQRLIRLKDQGIINFDELTGVVTISAAMTIGDLLNSVMAKGWFVPVTPGTRFVTIGGAVANDVHGKNHHEKGTFGNHVLSFTLLRSNNEVLKCSLTQNSDFFKASIGGLGLTGCILEVEMQLIPLVSSFIQTRTLCFKSLSHYIGLAQEYDQHYPYTVAWVDCLSGDDIRGHLILGDHDPSKPQLALLSKPFFKISDNWPSGFLNSSTVRVFNSCYYHKVWNEQVQTSSLSSFFYPLDQIIDWNKLYGRRGFYQFQCTLPYHEVSGLKRIFKVLKKSQSPSFLTVLKRFGKLSSPGLMSYPSPGFSFAADIKASDESATMFRILHKIVRDHNGRLYPAKDAFMSSDDFHDSYPQYESFHSFIDPMFSSSFWRRVGGCFNR